MILPQKESPIITRRCTGDAVVDLGSDEAVRAILDDTGEFVNALNIQILHVWDKDGNELAPDLSPLTAAFNFCISAFALVASVMPAQSTSETAALILVAASAQELK